MFTLYASDILQHWSITHALAVQQTNDRTLREMKRLPPHLLEDVNARGLPSDLTLSPRRNSENDKSINLMPAIKSIRLIDA